MLKWAIEDAEDLEAVGEGEDIGRRDRVSIAQGSESRDVGNTGLGPSKHSTQKKSVRIKI